MFKQKQSDEKLESCKLFQKSEWSYYDNTVEWFDQMSEGNIEWITKILPPIEMLQKKFCFIFPGRTNIKNISG